MEEILDNLKYEKELYSEGIELIAGVDEVGRGPLIGPVVAAAVILPQDVNIPGLNDSKKLSDKRRREMYPLIKEQAIAYSIAFATEEEIDSINILQATFLAMRRAVAQLSPQPDLTLVDGNVAREFPMRAVTVIKGDAKSPNIAAASILAKVERDRYCLTMHEKYPEYNFAGHKGYPTKEHMDLVRQHGPCPEHRRTFLKFLDK